MNDEDTRELLEDMGAEALRIANLAKSERSVRGKEIFDLVKSGGQSALYYPASGKDWEPLHHLSQRCDLFVYCDDGGCGCRSVSDFEIELREIHNRTSAGDRLQFQAVRVVDCPDNVGRNPEQSWAALANLTIRDTNGIRPLRLLYVQGYGEMAYDTLFHAQSVAPRIICICVPGAGGEQLGKRTGKLARLVTQGAAKPEFIVTHHPFFDDWDWGWNQVVQSEFTGWRGVSLLARPAPPAAVT